MMFIIFRPFVIIWAFIINWVFWPLIAFWAFVIFWTLVIFRAMVLFAIRTIIDTTVIPVIVVGSVMAAIAGTILVIAAVAYRIIRIILLGSVDFLLRQRCMNLNLAPQM